MSTLPGMAFHLPEDQRDLLIRACVCPRDKATAAWQEWCSLVETAPARHVDSSLVPEHYYTRLLSPFYRRMIEWNVESSQNNLVKRIHQKTWTRNLHLLNQLGQFVGLLDAEDISSYIMKGAALIVEVTQDRGYRYCSDMDLVVEEKNLERTLSIARETGWRATAEFDADTRKWKHAIRLERSLDVRLDLHWRPTYLWQRTSFSNELLAGCQPLHSSTLRCKVMSPSDLFFLLCAHGATLPGREQYWLIDATRVLESSRGLDADRIAYLARTSHTRHLLRNVLRTLRAFGLEGLPTEVEHFDPNRSNAVPGLFSDNLTVFERLSQANMMLGTDGPTGGMLARICEYIRLCSTNRQCFSPFSVLHYLRYHWKLANNLAVITKAGSLGVRTIKRLFLKTFTSCGSSQQNAG